MGAININHNEGSITTDNDTVLTITENGGVKIGDGSYLNDSDIVDESYKGVIRYNKDTDSIQYHNGVTWKNFSNDVEETPGIIWSITF